MRKPRKHWRVVIQFIEVKTDTDQPEIESVSLPGLFSYHSCFCFFKAVVKVAEAMREWRW